MPEKQKSKERPEEKSNELSNDTLAEVRKLMEQVPGFELPSTDTKLPIINKKEAAKAKTAATPEFT